MAVAVAALDGTNAGNATTATSGTATGVIGESVFSDIADAIRGAERARDHVQARRDGAGDTRPGVGRRPQTEGASPLGRDPGAQLPGRQAGQVRFSHGEGGLGGIDRGLCQPVRPAVAPGAGRDPAGVGGRVVRHRRYGAGAHELRLLLQQYVRDDRGRGVSAPLGYDDREAVLRLVHGPGVRLRHLLRHVGAHGGLPDVLRLPEAGRGNRRDRGGELDRLLHLQARGGRRADGPPATTRGSGSGGRSTRTGTWRSR